MKELFQPVTLLTSNKPPYEHLQVPMVEDFIKRLGPIDRINTIDERAKIEALVKTEG
jgi:hypothetical protein